MTLLARSGKPSSPNEASARPPSAASRSRTASLLFILFAGAIARLYDIGGLPADHHYFRQTQTLGTIVEFWRHGVDFLHPIMASMGKPGVLVLEFPLYQAIVASLYHVITPSVIVARVVTIAASVAAAYFVYKITQLFYAGREPLYAAAFFLFTPLSIFYGRVPMLDMLEIMLCVGFMYYLAAYIVGGKSTKYLVVGSLVACAAFTVKPPYAAPVFVALLYLCWITYGKRPKVGVVISMLVPVLAMFLWQRYANATNSLYQAQYPYKDLAYAIQVKLVPPNTWYFGTLAQRLQLGNYAKLFVRVLAGILAGAGAIPLVVGLMTRIEERDRMFYVWLAAVLGSFFVFFNLNVVHDYYQMPLLPVVAVFCARGLQLIEDGLRIRLSNSAVAISLTAFWVVYAACVCGVMWKVGYFRPLASTQVTAGQEMSRVLTDDSLVAVSTPSGDLWDPTILYFADKRGFTVPQARLDQGMLSYLRQSGVRWLVVTDGGALIPPPTQSLLRSMTVGPRASTLTIYRLQ